MNTKSTLIICLVFAAALLGACSDHEDALPSLTQQEKLIVDVFAPQPGEKVLVMVDIPRPGLSDNQYWEERRDMALEWLMTFEDLADLLEIEVHPLMTYEATGAHNGALPESGMLEDREVAFEEILKDTNIAVAMTEFSATAPLSRYTEQFSQLRVASMPGVSRSMEETALSADYAEVARKAAILQKLLDHAVGAEVVFSTGHEMYFDLRFRSARADDGQLHADREGERIINLPSGEAYIAPYEGEQDGESSQTEGMLPVECQGGELVVGRVVENKIVEVIGDGTCAREARADLALESGLTNVAELGLGVNDKAVVTGNVLEDEKVLGMHWALGLSDHIGGIFGPDDFDNPGSAVHIDYVYPKDAPIEISSLILLIEDGTSEQIILDGSYTIF